MVGFLLILLLAWPFVLVLVIGGMVAIGFAQHFFETGQDSNYAGERLLRFTVGAGILAGWLGLLALTSPFALPLMFLFAK